MTRFPTDKFRLSGIILSSLAIFMFIGCGSSKPVYEDDEWADRWAHDIPLRETPAQELALEELQSLNRTLRDEIRKLEQENHRLIERIAELERTLRDLTDQPITPPPPQPSPAHPLTFEQFEEEYNLGLSLFRQQRHQEAKNIFTKLIESGVQHPLIPNCQYWIGESLFGMGQYRQAIEELRKVFTYTDHTKNDDAQVMIANSYFMLGEYQQAREEYERLLNLYPNSAYAAFARQRIRQLQ